MIRATALKPSQWTIHSCSVRRKPAVQRSTQTTALALREKQKMQLTHSLADPRPRGNTFRIRSKTESGPRSFETKWLHLKVASAPETNNNQRTFLTRSLSAIRQVRRDAKDFHLSRLVCACSGIVLLVSSAPRRINLPDQQVHCVRL